MKLDELTGRMLMVDAEVITLAVEAHPKVPAGRVIEARHADGSLFGTLSLCVWGTTLGENEVIVKTTPQNAALVEAARASGWFEVLPQRIPLGFCEAEVWRLIR